MEITIPIPQQTHGSACAHSRDARDRGAEGFRAQDAEHAQLGLLKH